MYRHLQVLGIMPLLTVSAAFAAGDVSVLPGPQIEDRSGQLLALGGPDAVMGLICRNVAPGDCKPVELGVQFVASRVGHLGGRLVEAELTEDQAALAVERISAVGLAKGLREQGLAEKLSERRLSQAYMLRCGREGGRTVITVRACGTLGLYYGLLSVCQLLDKDADGRSCVPETTIADWPAIGLRLAKTSASRNPLRVLRAFAAWQYLLRMNLLGLQYHGRHSKEPEPGFLRNVQTLCGECRRDGVLETVVYFCPFMGKERAYDFRLDEDREHYVERLRWFLAQSAAGVEIDYNDWPDKTSGIQIEDVINFACTGIQEAYPSAYVLYCPPLNMYRGMASAELVNTLSKVPPKVWTLWTGMQTLIKTLKREDVKEWTRRAKRRPFLWVNRVFIGGQFSRELNKGEGDYVFRGEALPRELDELFEGVHFNAGLSAGYNRLPRTFTREALVYLATASDFVWNPKQWSAEDSYRSAARFVDTMLPLLGGLSGVGEPENLIPEGHPQWAVQSGAWREVEDGAAVEVSGQFAVALRREPPLAGRTRLRVEASVQTLEMVGNMNGHVVFGTESDEYWLAGAAFASQHWVLMRAKANSKSQRMLKSVKAEIPIEVPHRLRVDADYAAGEAVLRELVDGQWVERLRYQGEGLKRVSPVAGVAVKWGETEFKQFSVTEP